MPKGCSVYACTATTTNSYRSFHCFPTDATLRKAWISKLGRKNFIPCSSSYICSYHFNAEDFAVPRKETVPGQRKRCIKRGAVPSQNLNGEAEDTRCFNRKPINLKEAVRTNERQNQTSVTHQIDRDKNELMKTFANINFQYLCDPVSKKNAQDGKSTVCSMHVKDSDIKPNNDEANLRFGALPSTNISRKPQKRRIIEKYEPSKIVKQSPISSTCRATDTSRKDLAENLESFLGMVTSQRLLEIFSNDEINGEKELHNDEGTSTAKCMAQKDDQLLRTRLIQESNEVKSGIERTRFSVRPEADGSQKSVNKSSCFQSAQQVSIISESSHSAKMMKTNKFVIKNVGKVPKIFEASDLSYNINPVLKNAASRKCPIIYAGEPVFTDSEDFFNDWTEKKPRDAGPNEIVKKDSLYDIAKLQSVFLGTNSVVSKEGTSSDSRWFSNTSHLPLDSEELTDHSVSPNNASQQGTLASTLPNRIQNASKLANSTLATVPQIKQVVSHPAVIPQVKITSSAKTPCAIEAVMPVITKNDSVVLSASNCSKDPTIVSATCNSTSALPKGLPIGQSETSVSAPSRRNMKYILPKPPPSGSVMIVNFYPCDDRK